MNNKLPNILLIPFSGGCCSGKTTTIAGFAKYLKEIKSAVPELKDYTVIIHDEEVRRIAATLFPGKTIDEIRSVPADYLDFENRAIAHYIFRETRFSEPLREPGRYVILQDRALTDVLFYLEQYIDTRALSENESRKYEIYKERLINNIKESFKRYYTIFQMCPIRKSITGDTLRPADIDTVKYIEYERIKKLNEHYAETTKKYGGCPIQPLDVNAFSEKNIQDLYQKMLSMLLDPALIRDRQKKIIY